MIKILFFIETLKGGGAEKVLKNLVNFMDKSKFDITVQTLFPDDEGKTLPSGVKYKYCYSSSSKLNRLVMRAETAAGLTYPLHIKGDYDVEVAYLECGSTKIMAASTNKKAKKLAWVHCDLSVKFADSESFVPKAEKLYAKYDDIACVSQGVKAGFEKLFGKSDRVKIVYNTVDDEEIRRLADAETIKNDVPTVLSLGRLSKQKRFDRLIRAHKILIDCGIVHELHIFGEGQERLALEKLVNELSVSSTVKFFGYCDNPYPHIKAADVCVCSSDYEGISTFITESLILGKAIVTTDCTGMKELLKNGECGIITALDENALSEGIKKILTDKSAKSAYEQKAEARGLDFNSYRLAKETEDFIENTKK